MNRSASPLTIVIGCWLAMYAVSEYCPCFFVNRNVLAQDAPLTKKPRPTVDPLINPSQIEFASQYLFGSEAEGGLPKAKDVREIYAEVYVGPPYGAKIERFRIPKDDIDAIMGCFRAARIDSDPNLLLTEVGCLRISTSDDVTRTITWFAGGKAPLCFSVKGIRCVADVEQYDKGSDRGAMLIGLIRTLSKKNAKAE